MVALLCTLALSNMVAFVGDVAAPEGPARQMTAARVAALRTARMMISQSIEVGVVPGSKLTSGDSSFQIPPVTSAGPGQRNALPAGAAKGPLNAHHGDT
jgi:hypothetical protein